MAVSIEVTIKPVLPVMVRVVHPIVALALLTSVAAACGGDGEISSSPRPARARVPATASEVPGFGDCQAAMATTTAVLARLIRAIEAPAANTGSRAFSDGLQQVTNSGRGCLYADLADARVPSCQQAVNDAEAWIRRASDAYQAALKGHQSEFSQGLAEASEVLKSYGSDYLDCTGETPDEILPSP